MRLEGDERTAFVAAPGHRLVGGHHYADWDGYRRSGHIPRQRCGDGPELGAVMPGCYCAISLGMIALAYHLRARGPSAYLAGVLLAATLFATGLGLVMLPTSILGTLFAGIGVLGLSPFLTALVFGARTRLAFRDAPAEGRLPRFLFGFLLYAGVCSLVQWRIDAVWARS